MKAEDIDDIAATIDLWFAAGDCRKTIVAVATELHCPPSRQGMRRAMIEYLVDMELRAEKRRKA